jgi:branched-chain amino acid transport system substrate-binding protein
MATPDTPRRRNDGEFLVGGIFSLTGYLSWSGEYKRKGALLKIEMINEAGGVNGRSLKLIAYDDCSSPARAAGIAELLVSKHHAVALIGTGSLPISSAVARVANTMRVPVFLNSGYAVDPIRDLFVFNTSHKTEFALACSFHYFREVGIDRIALLMPKGPLGDLGSWLGRMLSNQLGLKIVGEERFDADSMEMASQLGRLRSLKPLALFSFVTGEPAARMAGTMARMGMRIPLLVSHGNSNPAFLKLVSHTGVPLIVPSGKTMILDSMPDNDPCKKRVIDFNKRHIRRFGEPANYSSAESADAIDLLAEGLGASGQRDGRQLRDAVEGIKQFEGMQGVYDMSPIDHYGTEIEHVVLLDVREGTWHMAQRFSSIEVFEALHDDQKTRLIFKLANAFGGPCSGDLVGPVVAGGAVKAMTARVGLSCTNLKPDPGFALKLSRQEKQELICAVREENYVKAEESLYRLLTISVLEYFDAFEDLRFAVSELFHAFFDAAAREELVDLEPLVQLKYRYTREWSCLQDQEALCSWTVRAFRETMDLLHGGQRERGSGLLKSILRFIEAHFAEDLSVDRVAREVCLSPSRLIHRMKTQYGLKLSDCIATVRIDKAKALLRETNMSISEIALEVGYQDQGYFTKVFKRCLNDTPMKFRDASQKNLTPLRN